MAGTLYLVATPIGNLEDITARALRILSEVDLIAAEDTRVSRKLLNHFQIRKPLISYYEQNKQLRQNYLLGELQSGQDIALICDAGTPGLSDPGADLAKAAIDADIEVVAVPGASALLTALTSSGLENGPFCFEGFLPRGRSERRKRLSQLADEHRVMVFYEAPHRLISTLTDMQEIFGPERRMAACRELTKLHEEKRRGTICELLSHFVEVAPRGEFSLVVDGAEEITADIPTTDVLRDKLELLIKEGLSRKQAAKQLAQQHGLKAKEIYALGLNDIESAE